MDIVRTILGVVVGYVAFAVGSMLFLGPVMAAEGNNIVILPALLALALLGLVAGWLATAIAGRRRRLAGFLLGGLVTVATLANLILQLEAEPTWYKAGTLLLTVPAIVLAGLRRAGHQTSSGVT